MSDIVEMEIGVDTLASVAGDICVELLRQHKDMVALDENAAPIETSLEEIAQKARQLAIICCTGIDQS